MKLAMLLCKLFNIFKDIQIMNKLITQIASAFITGHFMSFKLVNSYIKKIIENNTDSDIKV